MQHKCFPESPNSQFSSVSCNFVPVCNKKLWKLSLPDKIELVVTHTEPAVKGNTTQNALKDATVETGLLVRVPLFIEEGETIIVSTADGKYVSRA